jgi:hypothetical protein
MNGRYHTARQIFEFADFILCFYRFFLKDLLGAYVVNNITGVCEPYDTSDNLAAADG